MTGIVLAAFVISFVVGPVLCAVFLKLPSTVVVLVSMAALVVAPMAVALWLETRAPIASLTLMWLGWVAACAMVGHAFLRRLDGPRLRRWITVTAILSTTLPWFGLATARLMT